MFSRFSARPLSFLPMPSVPVPKGPTAAQLAARAAHGAALALGVATMSHAWADATTKARQLVFSAFCTYVTQLGFTLADMGPGDIIAWFEGTYIPAHQGSLLPDGTACTSVSGVFSALAHLSTAYTMTGRDEIYTSTNPHGNPCKHSMITIWRRAYRIKMFVLGLKVGSAVPLSQAKVMALLAYVDQRASKAPTALACICCLQDYLCFLFCWLSCMRGKDSGKLELGDLFLGPDGTAQLAYPLPPIIPAGTVVVVKPNGDKTHRSCRGDPIPVTAGLFGWDDYPNRLSHYLHLCARSGHGVSKHMFRPLKPSRTGFKEAPYARGSLWTKLCKYLNAMGQYSGEGMHSFRRGKIQAAAAAGADDAAIARLSRIKTRSVRQVYLHPGRHYVTLAKQRARRAASKAKAS